MRREFARDLWAAVFRARLSPRRAWRVAKLLRRIRDRAAP